MTLKDVADELEAQWYGAPPPKRLVPPSERPVDLSPLVALLKDVNPVDDD